MCTVFRTPAAEVSADSAAVETLKQVIAGHSFTVRSPFAEVIVCPAASVTMQ